MAAIVNAAALQMSGVHTQPPVFLPEGLHQALELSDAADLALSGEGGGLPVPQHPLPPPDLLQAVVLLCGVGVATARRRECSPRARRVEFDPPVGACLHGIGVDEEHPF